MKSAAINTTKAKNVNTDLDAVFNPRSVAIVGASSTFGKWGQLITSNIVAGDFRGKVFPVNPKDELIC
ncbi:MAG: CoA-binding protein, partial [Deltaproteobacteria bacterium]|nr:CoA-binding protein [Deltaproteobacteria bacterium]